MLKFDSKTDDIVGGLLLKKHQQLGGALDTWLKVAATAEMNTRTHKAPPPPTTTPGPPPLPFLTQPPGRRPPPLTSLTCLRSWHLQGRGAAHTLAAGAVVQHTRRLPPTAGAGPSSSVLACEAGQAGAGHKRLPCVR